MLRLVIAIALCALSGPLAAQTFIGMSGGTNFHRLSDHKHEITDAYGNVIAVNYSPDPNMFGHGGALLQFGSGRLAYRLGGQYVHAGKIDVLGGAGTSKLFCKDLEGTITECPDADFYPNQVTRYIVGHFDLLLRPIRPEAPDRVNHYGQLAGGNWFLPYVLLAPEIRYRLNNEAVADVDEYELSTYVTSLAAGAGAQVDFYGMNWQRDLVLPRSMFFEVRYTASLNALVPVQTFRVGEQRVKIGEPYKETAWMFRFGFMFNPSPVVER